MEGEILDLNGVREAQSFGKTKMVVEDLDIDDLLGNVTINNDIIKPVGLNGAPTVPEPVIQSNQKSDTRAIAEAIKSAVRSSRAARSARGSRPPTSSRESGKKPIVEIPPNASETRRPSTNSRVKNMFTVREEGDLIPPSAIGPNSQSPMHSGIKIPEPILSQRAEVQMQEEEEDYEEVDMMPQTDDEKHLYWKTRLQILRTRFVDVTIPKNAADMPWRSLRKIYYIEMDRVSISKNVEGYKMVMIVMFFILEYIGAKYLKINITGFTVHSLKTMHRYERLLIELGEKDYAGFAQNWPVEVRLAGLVAVNAIIFVVAKYVFKLSGQDTSDEFFDLFQNLGTATADVDVAPDAGMNAPAPGKENNNGMMGMLSGLLNSFGGGGGGGGIGDIFKAFGGGNNNNNNDNKPAAGGDDATGTGDGSRVKPPTYRRRKKKKDDDNKGKQEA